MDTMYNTTIALTLSPVWHNDPPLVEMHIDGQTQQVNLTSTQTFNYQTQCYPKNLIVSVRLLNKKDSDTIPEKNLDKAVVVESLSINGITDPMFVWLGKYRPDYPEPWYSQQITKPQAVLDNQNYLGWNGVWSVDVEVPAFQWIHQKLGLGWIYD
jgi:hypothetical protein